MPDPRHLLGEQGEAMAATWLDGAWLDHPRAPLALLRQVSSTSSPVDPDGALVAVEVKLRRAGRAGDPLESVDRRRLLRLRAALGQFRATHRELVGGGLRIDLVTVVPRQRGTLAARALHAAIDAW